MKDRIPRGREETVSLEEIVKAARRAEGGFFSAREVAEHVDIGTERVRQRLKELEADGILDHKQIGSGKAYYFK